MGEAIGTNNAPKIGLALSGGGYRATLFHIGVVLAMKECGVFQYVRSISSASGGSILAAHIALHWERYIRAGINTGVAESIGDVCDPIVEKIRSGDVRGKIVALYPLFVLWVIVVASATLAVSFLKRTWARSLAKKALRFLSPSYFLRRHWDSLYQRQVPASEGAQTGSMSGTLAMFRDPKAREVEHPRPQVGIIATNLSLGTIAEFSGAGYKQDLCAAKDTEAIRGDGTPIALAVAASASFPVVIWPTMYKLPGAPTGDEGIDVHYLSDGGLSDNLGIGCLSLNDRAERLDFVLISDATGVVKKDGRIRSGSVLNATLRQIEVVTRMNQFFQLLGAESDDESVFTAEIKGSLNLATPAELQQTCRYVRSSIGSHDATKEWPEWHGDVSNALRTLRTDLDIFSRDEIRALVAQGYLVGRSACRIGMEKWHRQHETYPTPRVFGCDFGKQDWLPRMNEVPGINKSKTELERGSAHRKRPRRARYLGLACLTWPLAAASVVYVVWWAIPCGAESVWSWSKKQVQAWRQQASRTGAVVKAPEDITKGNGASPAPM